MTADPTIIAALATNPAALTAYLAACEGTSEPTTAAPTMPAPAKPTRSRKVKPATAKVSKPKPAGTRKPKPETDVFTVQSKWAGEKPSPRMVGACLYHGMTAAAVAKVQGDKFTCASALGNHRVKLGHFTKVEVV